MIIVTFTPHINKPRDLFRLQEFLDQVTKGDDNRELVQLPHGTRVFDHLDDTPGRGTEQVLRALSYSPKRTVVIDARDPDPICHTLRTLESFAGRRGFSARDVANRFYIISQNQISNTLNQLVSMDDEHLRVLLSKPFFDQVMFF